MDLNEYDSQIRELEKHGERAEAEKGFKRKAVQVAQQAIDALRWDATIGDSTPAKKKLGEARRALWESQESLRDIGIVAEQIQGKIAVLQLQRADEVKAEARERLARAIPARVEPLKAIDGTLAALFENLQAVQAQERAALQDCVVAGIEWEPHQLMHVLNRLITEAMNRIQSNRAPEAMAGTLEKRLTLAVKHPQPDQPAQADNVQAEIAAAAANLIQ